MIDETPSQPDLPPEPAAAAEPAAEAANPAESAVEAKPVRARRSRAKAVKAEPEVQETAETPAEPELPATPSEPAPKRSRRKPAATDKSAATDKPAEDSEPATPAASDDSLAASLAQLGQRAPRRRGRVRAEAFGLAEDADPEAVLNSLAAAIGGAALPAADAEDDDAEEADEEVAQAVEAEDDETEVVDSDEDADDDEAGSGSARRRRRRRGGRRRRRSGGEDADEIETEADAETGEATGDDPEEAESADPEGAAESGSRRRRRRRRRGEDTGEAEDESIDVVVRVREPRRRGGSANDEVTGIEGSTRMEAKKQRRREGRAAGRRRTPILSESEFLARRESVDRVMLIRQAEEYSQIAVLEDGILVEHYVDRPSATSMIGNIYLGRVQNVLPSMEAAFIDIGRGRNAVLYAGEVDWASFGVTGQDKKVEKVFKSGQSVLVQVTKDPVGAKGARLTSHISIPGRYIVYSPGGQLSGISRKLPEPERKRLKGILDDLIGPDASVIVRTAAEGASEDELVRDVNRLKAQWEVIEKKTGGSAPSLLYGEPDLTVRIVRDLFTEDFRSLIVDGNGGPEDAWDTVQAYVSHVAPHLAERLQRWDREASGDIFNAHRVHEQVAKALERKVFLPSGGSLIIDRTEAMTVIDVNTGRFTGTSGNLEATVTSNNLEAAEEIVRQLRLRDIGGIIVIDFIDMVLPSNRELLLRRLVECLGRDRTRHQVAEVTSLGLVQMTRKKIGTGLAEAFTVACETCKGRGYHTHDVPVATQAPADGGEREGNRRGRGGSSSSRANNRGRKPGVAPELAAVVAATLAHPVTPKLAKSAEEAEPAVESVEASASAEPVAEPVEASVANPEQVVQLDETEADAVATEEVPAPEDQPELVTAEPAAQG
ncbi:MAG: Rne/Rng family ribonuclease [Propionicimonas sp.]